MNHAYGLTDVFELLDPFLRKKMKIMRLRNPWGNSEWLGAWSGDSPEIKKYGKLLTAYIKKLPPDE